MRFSENALRSVINVDGAMVLDIDHDRIVSLNCTGGFVWERLQKRVPIDQIIRDLANETGAALHTVDADVRAFLEELKANNLLSR
jgi:hypothetical protein